MFPHGLGQAAGSQMKRTFKGQLKDSTEHVDKGHLETLTTQHFRKGLPLSFSEQRDRAFDQFPLQCREE